MKKISEEKLEKERLRLESMKEYEKAYSHCKYICGIDEAGRGPLAGPVVAAAVVLDTEKEILFLNDSKKLSEKKREVLYEEILEKAISYSIGIVDSYIIDELNILQATYKAMKIAVEKLDKKPDVLLNDAVTIPGIDIEQVPIIKGDAKSISIAAASILAKVTRDRLMHEYAQIYPEYAFEKHKGYGTKEHILKLKEIGPCDIHRRSFIKNILK